MTGISKRPVLRRSRQPSCWHDWTEDLGCDRAAPLWFGPAHDSGLGSLTLREFERDGGHDLAGLLQVTDVDLRDRVCGRVQDVIRPQDEGRRHAGVVLVDDRTVRPDDAGGLVRALAALERERGGEDRRDRVVYLTRG